jgi:hypothetical protein
VRDGGLTEDIEERRRETRGTNSAFLLEIFFWLRVQDPAASAVAKGTAFLNRNIFAVGSGHRGLCVCVETSLCSVTGSDSDHKSDCDCGSVASSATSHCCCYCYCAFSRGDHRRQVSAL